ATELFLRPHRAARTPRFGGRPRREAGDGTRDRIRRAAHRDARVRRSPRPLPRRAAAVSAAQEAVDRAVRRRWRLAGVVAQPLAGPAAAVQSPGSGAGLEGLMSAPAIPLVDMVAQHRVLEDELVAA